VSETFGWLAKEEKVAKTRDKEDIYVSLTQKEQEQQAVA